LAAEIYARQGNNEQAALHYVAAAQHSNEVAIAKRAVELALQANNIALAQRGLERWVALDPKSLDAMQSQAMMYMRADKPKEAAKQLIALRDTLDKQNGRGFDFVISLMMLERQIDKTYATFKEYVALEGDSTKNQLVLASLALNTEHFDEALKAATLVLKKGNKPEKERAAYYHAKSLLGLKRYQEAVDEFEKLVPNSKDPNIKYDYARALILLDRHAEATPLFKQLHANQPNNADIIYTLALLYLEQKDFTAAESVAKQLMNMPGRAEDAYYFMGQIQEGLKKPQEALDYFKKASQSGNFTKEATTRAASLMMKQNNLEDARKWLQAAFKKVNKPDAQADILLAEAQLLFDAKRYAESLTLIEQANTLLPNDKSVLYARSLSREKLGNVQGAEADLREILKQSPDNATILNALGYLLVENTTKYSEAEQFIQQALKLQPDDAAIMDSFGWVLYHTNKLTQSEDWLRKAYDILKDPEIASHLVEVLIKQGKQQEAKQVLQEMLVKFPQDPMLVKVKEKFVDL
jgi:tetratricopeptide (TPR) repeat protein